MRIIMKTFNEIRDYQHTIARKRDGMVKTELQKKGKNNRKHSFLYGYNQSKYPYANRRLIGKPGDNV